MPGKHYPKKGFPTTSKAKNPKPKAKKLASRAASGIGEGIAELTQTFFAKRNDGKTVGTPPKKYGAYKMYPGKHSEVNPGNFRGSEVRKYSAMKLHPMKFEDQKGTSPGITQADVVSARTKGYNPKMYGPKMYDKPQAHHPMKGFNSKHPNQLKKAPPGVRLQGTVGNGLIGGGGVVKNIAKGVGKLIAKKLGK